MFVVKMRPAPVRQIVIKQLTSCPSRVSAGPALPALLVLILSSLSLSGCGGIVVLSGSKSTTADAPTIAATPSSVDFGSVGVGSTVDKKISLTNKGSDSVQISQLSLSSAAFHVDGEGKLPVTLDAGSSLSLNVHFSPSTDSDSSDQLSVITSASSTAAAAIKLHGKGTSGSADLSGLNCDAATMSDAGSTSCTVSTSMAAPSGGLQVKLSSNSSAIKVPASVTVPVGAGSVKFSATISKVSSDEMGVITATHGSTAKSFSISLSPATAAAGAPELKSLSCTTTSFSAAGKTTCALSLSAKSSKSLSVALSSTSSAVVVPASATIASGSTTATFVATVAATSTTQTATIVATSNGTSRNVSIQLKPSKTGASSAALSLSTASMQFGDVAVGTAVTKSVTVTSTGNAPVNIKSDSTTGNGFTVSGGSFPSSLNPGQAVVLTVHFNPTAAGSASGMLTIASSAGSQTISLTGNGMTATPTLSALTCSGSSIVGSLADPCKVTLSGAAPKGGVTIALASSSTNVKVPASLAIPATATTATFTATAAAVSTAQTVKLTATAGSVSKSISLQLSPASAQLSVDATTISFGSVILNQTTTQLVTLSSVGKAAVTVQSVAISGTGFSLSPVSLPTTLNPGQALVLTLVYKASITGSQKGLLTITSNSSTNPSLTINLAASTSGHRVELSWNAPASSSVPLSSYSVYRASGSSGSFAKIGSSGQPSYTDSGVQPGSSYRYYVTSVASTGESKPSNTYTVTIP
ncbi:MAG: choice-of-anchor D domain-containing protein [Acidobacteria bacterium]|nr:choice-of-anchor D domain-containing protein [Acidobacteriota bacterium]